jgi:hypothetical protein
MVRFIDNAQRELRWRVRAEKTNLRLPALLYPLEIRVNAKQL